MKTLAFVLGFLVAALNVTLAQSSSPEGHPNYFGTSSPNGVDNTTTAKPADPAGQNSAVSGKQPDATQETKTQVEEPEMKKVFPLLKEAKDKIQSTTSSTAAADSLASAEAAFGALKKTNGDGRYRGHRAKAIGKLKDAIAELKAGNKTNKAGGYLSESIAEVNLCEGLSR